jgi:hypothetical protein
VTRLALAQSHIAAGRMDLAQRLYPPVPLTEDDRRMLDRLEREHLDPHTKEVVDVEPDRFRS